MAELSFNVVALDKASQTFIKMAEQVDRLSKKIDQLDRKEANVRVDADTTQAERKIDKLDRKLDKGFGDTVIKVAALGRSLSTLAMPAALITSLGAAGPLLAGIASTAATASGALLVLPGAAAAGAAAMATLKIGTQGFGEALKSIGDPEKFAEAISSLAPAARETALAVRDIKPGFDSMRLDVQQRLFSGLSDTVRKLADTYLPVLSTGMTQVAGAMNQSAGAFSRFLQAPQTVRDVGTIFGNAANAVRPFAAALVNIGGALRDVAAVGSGFVPNLAEGFQLATQRMQSFVASARQSGQLKQWIQAGLDTLAALGSALADLGGIIKGVFQAASQGAGQALGPIGALLDGVNKWVNSFTGQQALSTFFTAAKTVVQALLPVLGQIASVIGTVVAPAIASIAKGLGPGLSAVVNALGQALKALAPSLGPLAQAIGSILKAIAPILPVIGQLAAIVARVLASALRAVAPLLKTMVQTLSAALAPILPIVSRLLLSVVNAFRPMVPMLGELVRAILPVLAQLFGSLLQAVMPLIPPLLNIVKAILPTLISVFKTIMPVISKLANVLINILAGAIKLVVVPALNLIAGILRNVVGPVVVWLFRNIIAPIFKAIGAVVEWLWRNIIRPIFSFIGNALRVLGGVFRWAWNNAIKPIWNALGNGIRWVWENVIRPVFNAVKTAVGWVRDSFKTAVEGIKNIWNTLQRIAAKPVNFIIETVYNGGIRKVWNWIADKIGLPQLPKVNPVKVPGRESGGLVPVSPMVTNGPMAIVGEGRRQYPEYVIPTDPKYRGRAQALWASAGSDMQMMADGGILGNILGGIGKFAKMLANPLDSLKSMFAKPLEGLRRFADTGVGRLMIGVPKKIVSGAIEWLVDKVKSWVPSFGGGGGDIGGSGVQQWAPLVLRALAMLGQPASLLPNVLRRMNQESGGNPRAINLWDSNAARGTPSIGLMQTIGPTFDAYAGQFRGMGIYNPFANIYAGLNYAIQRYGSLRYAMDKPGGYANGLLATKPTLGVFGEAGPELLLPLNRPQRAEQLARQAGLGGGGTFVGTLVLSSGEYLGAIRGTVRQEFSRMELESGVL